MIKADEESQRYWKQYLEELGTCDCAECPNEQDHFSSLNLENLKDGDIIPIPEPTQKEKECANKKIMFELATSQLQGKPIDCNQPLRIEDTNLLPLTNFLAEHGLLDKSK